MARWVFVLLLTMGWLVAAQLYRDYLILENFLAFRYRYVHASAEVNRTAREVLEPGFLIDWDSSRIT